MPTCVHCGTLITATNPIHLCIPRRQEPPKSKQPPLPSELNPQHPMSEASRDLWHKILALYMLSKGETEVSFTGEEIDKIFDTRPQGTNVTIREHEGKLTIRLVDNATAQKLANS